ncbi:NUDIX hydrolase [Ancylobacter terrae]|uniref:NUDIX hydrolase n=1 Tax=Ancylobacter sp. sgz301288 TaxID=3342077 RepID=UPI00385BE037
MYRQTPRRRWQHQWERDAIVSRAKKTGTAKGRKRLKTASNGRALRQIAALAYRIAADGGIEFLMMSSRETRRFVIPKGWPMKGRKAWKSAQIEARQEAGVLGEIARRRIGQYRYWKRMDGFFALVEVAVYPMRVKRQLAEWPERHERAQRWLPPADAALLVDEPDLGELIRLFAAGFPDPERPPPDMAPDADEAVPGSVPPGDADVPEAVRPKTPKGKAAKKTATPAAASTSAAAKPKIAKTKTTKTKTTKAKAAKAKTARRDAAEAETAPGGTAGPTDEPVSITAAVPGAPEAPGETKRRTRKSRAKKRPAKSEALEAEHDAGPPTLAPAKKKGKAKSAARKPRKGAGRKPPAEVPPEAEDS